MSNAHLTGLSWCILKRNHLLFIKYKQAESSQTKCKFHHYDHEAAMWWQKRCTGRIEGKMTKLITNRSILYLLPTESYNSPEPEMNGNLNRSHSKRAVLELARYTSLQPPSEVPRPQLHFSSTPVVWFGSNHKKNTNPTLLPQFHNRFCLIKVT